MPAAALPGKVPCRHCIAVPTDVGMLMRALSAYNKLYMLDLAEACSVNSPSTRSGEKSFALVKNHSLLHLHTQLSQQRDSVQTAYRAHLQSTGSLPLRNVLTEPVHFFCSESFFGSAITSTAISLGISVESSVTFVTSKPWFTNAFR